MHFLLLLILFSVPSFVVTLRLYMGTGNSFGKLFRITTFGESHGAAVGVIIDGCPPNIQLTSTQIQDELNRRKPGQSKLTTPRKEDDLVEVLSGMEGNRTTGTPICAIVRNQNQKSQDYDDFRNFYRPSHADATYDAKYGIRSVSGGGRSSARETIARVIGGAVAKAVLKSYCDMEILGYVLSVQEINANVNPELVTSVEVESNIIRCPDKAASERMIQRIDEIRRQGNSVGGVVEAVARNVPVGLGSPVFDKLDAELAKACISLPAAKGFEIGSGFSGTLSTGVEHNDPFYNEAGRIRTRSNKSGGVQGGITNGETVLIRVAFKPTATIAQLQQTVSTGGEETLLRGKGRHDPCVLPRAVPLVESMMAITMLDALLQHHGQCRLFPLNRESRLGKQLNFFKLD